MRNIFLRSGWHPAGVGDREKPGEAALTGGACSLWRVAGWPSTFSSSRWAALPADTELPAQRCLPRFFPVSLSRTTGFNILIVPAQEHFSLSRHAPIEDRGEYSGLMTAAFTIPQLRRAHRLGTPRQTRSTNCCLTTQPMECPTTHTIGLLYFEISFQ